MKAKRLLGWIDMHISYKRAVDWIAQNDESGVMDLEDMGYQVSVMLVADLFGKDSTKVAKDVIARRHELYPQHFRRTD